MFIGCKTCIYSVQGSRGYSRKLEYICNYGFRHNTTCLKKSGDDIRNYPDEKYIADKEQLCYLRIIKKR